MIGCKVGDEKMKDLNREYLLETNPDFVNANDKLPEKILMFGEGKFNRAFHCFMIQTMNDQGIFNGRIIAVQPIEQGGILDALEGQDYYYTVMHRGKLDGEVVQDPKIIGAISRGIRSVSEWDTLLETARQDSIEVVISNTTEAGLDYLKEDFTPEAAPVSYPGKITAWLYERFKFFKDKEVSGGVVIMPCELLEQNGEILKARINQKIDDWNLPEEFRSWVTTSCSICSTLVDRIVTGPPPSGEEEKIAEALGYKDEMLTTCEPYLLFVVNGDERVRDVLPFHEAGLNVRFEPEGPYKKIKVSFLNGAHTLMCAVGISKGIETVGEMLANPETRQFIMTGVYDEIFPVVDLPADKKTTYIDSIFERFENPFVRHMLKDIAMNGVSKFRERLLPSFTGYVSQYHRLPNNLTQTLSSILYLYKNSELTSDSFVYEKDDKVFEIKETPTTIEVFKEARESTKGDDREYVRRILGSETLWGKDLTKLPNLTETVLQNIRSMENPEAPEVLETFVSEDNEITEG